MEEAKQHLTVARWYLLDALIEDDPVVSMAQVLRAQQECVLYTKELHRLYADQPEPDTFVAPQPKRKKPILELVK